LPTITSGIQKIKRGFQKPPGLIIRYLFRIANDEMERYRGPLRERKIAKGGLFRTTGYKNINDLWKLFADRPYPALVQSPMIPEYDTICPGDREQILREAKAALAHQVDLLGSGPVDLGENIDWHRDYKTGIAWEPAFFKDIDYNNPELPGDVKFPWELSRMQWLIPVGQAYMLTGDERYAAFVRDILTDWIRNNPYAYSVNWSCTMEAALRIISWTWFFHVFYGSRSWTETDFQYRFLNSLYLHGDFTVRHLERSDINGNHYTADAAGLVFVGLFFGQGKAPMRWQKIGWKILKTELPRQTFTDGVDFEASIAYHRLVTELFFLPALYREAFGMDVPGNYRERVIGMVRFAAYYNRNNGSTPLWGDADDARALPLGGQDSINDHRYLTGWLGTAWNVPELTGSFSGPRREIFWLLGPKVAGLLPDTGTPLFPLNSRAFPAGGFYIMRNARDHVFIDCGPVGMAGRGGHGHNDCLSFEAMLDGVHLITDCGTYVYTASYPERNLFRSTSFHNTPQIDGGEVNRFVHPDYLWLLRNDAVPSLGKWETGSVTDIFIGSHGGYRRLQCPVTPERTIALNHESHSLTIEDRFTGEGEHEAKIPLHLAPGVTVQYKASGSLQLILKQQSFVLQWSHPLDWELTIEAARVSERYGVTVPSTRLLWRRFGLLNKPLTITITPANIY
jgi:uncharacterized heparinase superfamily protein